MYEREPDQPGRRDAPTMARRSTEAARAAIARNEASVAIGHLCDALERILPRPPFGVTRAHAALVRSSRDNEIRQAVAREIEKRDSDVERALREAVASIGRDGRVSRAASTAMRDVLRTLDKKDW